MASDKDIRWVQRFSNFKKAFVKLDSAAKKSSRSELEQEGLIQRFEYTYELAWSTLKDFFEYQGYTEISGSRDAFKLAIERGLIQDGKEWMKMIENRQRTSHTYNQETADDIAELIIDSYVSKFGDLIKVLESEVQKQIQPKLFEDNEE
jgi:nucleotidyltransferase substrate binding protein (TIGR01987 family)